MVSSVVNDETISNRPIDGTVTGTTTPVRVDLGVMVVKGYSIFPLPQERSLTIRCTLVS